MEEHYAVVKDIPISVFLFKDFFYLCIVLISGWGLGRNEQNTCSVRSFYAAALPGGQKSLLELCLRGKQVGLAACNLKLLGTLAILIVQEQAEAVSE